jgi:alpha-beta hydrolase superfamily lysophospholipase
MPRRLAGLVTIAAAPDFTEDRYWAGFDADQRRALERDGFVLVDSPYDDKPYRITRDLIEDGRANRILTRALGFPCPTRILHGSADAAIPVETAYRLFDHAEADDMRLIVVKGADHRFSSPACLELIKRMIDEVGGPKDPS